MRQTPSAADVLRIRDIDLTCLAALLDPYQLRLQLTEPDQVIPGSFWGDEEAGLIGNTLYIRPDTPIHSALHEAGHYICMSADRRKQLDTNAGGDYDEENGVCYLQILLSDKLKGLNKSRMLADMDRWGYSFRLGSARKWFEHDAEDARNWLIKMGIIDDNGRPSGQLASPTHPA
ncbi:FIG01181932: hypothetical protein [hydrothermal vent metagenome]|uniref:Uncharacterized protein n=1 Tax=hydrothermal vent metagenome TaxID=652676 RepID=A0A3B1A145_9ZZZZ